MTVYDEIINKREMKVVELEDKMKKLDDELYDMYMELEYFYEKRRLDQ